MNGYQGLVNDFLALVLSYLTIAVTFIEYILPDDLARSLNMTYQFVLRSGSWAGFMIAAIYYFGIDVGYAEYFCIVTKYIYISIYWLNVLITMG